MKIIKMSFSEFCDIIPTAHEPNHRSARYADCAISIDQKGTLYTATNHLFYKHFPVIFRSFTDKMLKLIKISSKMDGNMLLELTFDRYKVSDKLYVVDLNDDIKMISDNSQNFARYINPYGQTIICYSLLGIILIKGRK